MLNEKLQQELIARGRAFSSGYPDPYEADFESDQNLKKPMPPLVKPPMAGHSIPLPQDFAALNLNVNLAQLMFDRKSSRKYTQQSMSLLELSFLLWATQGIKKLRGTYATLRTVPCGGARHEFETYLVVNQVEGLEPGIYHYLPMGHALEQIGPQPSGELLSQLLCGQHWGVKANVVFFWSMVPYRSEWRYGYSVHRTALIDAGHVGQNLYLAATALGLGTCGVGDFDHETCNRVFSLDGYDEYVAYCAPVGTISHAAADADAEEREVYSFVYENTTQEG